MPTLTLSSFISHYPQLGLLGIETTASERIGHIADAILINLNLY